MEKTVLCYSTSKMSAELKLVGEIEKHECLYNYKLAEYSRKDLTEKAWGEIAAKTELSTNDCKEKWRNIRSSFLRSMKAHPNGSKTKKPYYLKEYLQFVLPYVKPLNTMENPSNSPQLKTETATDPTVAASSEETQNTDDSNAQNEPTAERPATRRRKRPLPEAEKPPADHSKNQGRACQTEETANRHCRYKSMRYFLQSLLPEFETMNEDQIRIFKIRVMILINEMKSNASQQSRIPFYSAYCETHLEPSLSSTSSPNRFSETASSPAEQFEPVQNDENSTNY